MKTSTIFLLVALSFFSTYQVGSANRIHHWVDSNGVAHLSKEPPPPDGKLIEVIEYSDPKDKPAKTDQVESGKKPVKQERALVIEQSQATEEQPQSKVDLATACYIYADIEDVYVYVTEYADPDRVLEKILYQGTIARDQRQVIQSSRGKIQFDYQPSSDDLTYGDNHADCVNGNVISIP